MLWVHDTRGIKSHERGCAAHYFEKTMSSSSMVIWLGAVAGTGLK